MKPSLGRVPAGGPNPPGWLDLSTNGPMARRIADVTLALDVAVGPDPTDLRALPRPEANWLAALEDPHVPVRIAYAPTLGYATVDAEVAAACERAVGVLESLGADVVVLDSVFDDDPVGDFLTVTGAATLRTLRPFMGHPRWEEVHPVLRYYVDAAQSTTAEQLLVVFDNYHRMNLRLVELFHSCRILVTPTCSALAPLADDMVSPVNGVNTANWVQFTYPFNMTRSPAASVPIAMSSDGLPIGLQLVGPQHGDLVVLRTAAALEAAIDHDFLATLPEYSGQPDPSPPPDIHHRQPPPQTIPPTSEKEHRPMSITTPANPADAVRLVTIEDAPWADTGTGVLLKVVRYDSSHGHVGDPQPLPAGRAAADAPPHGVGRRLHVGGALALPRVRLLHLRRAPTSTSRPTPCTRCTCPTTTRRTPTSASSLRARC